MTLNRDKTTSKSDGGGDHPTASTCNHSMDAAPSPTGAAAAASQHLGGDVETRDRAAGADRGCGPSGRGPSAATDVEHPFAGRQSSGGEQLVGHRCQLWLEHLGLLHPPCSPVTLPRIAQHLGHVAVDGSRTRLEPARVTRRSTPPETT